MQPVGVSMSVLSYPYEKFMVAIDVMATSASPLKERMYSAFMSFMTLQANDFDAFPEIKADWTELMSKLTARKAKGDEGDVKATLNAMTDDEARAVAENIFSLFIDIANEELRSRKP